MLAGILLMVLLTGIIAGMYPALYLSGFQPVVVLKGLTKTSFATQFIRKVLVIFQFSISVFLISCVLLLNRQVSYMRDKDLGFTRENVVSVRGITKAIRNAYPALKAELEQNPSVLHVTASQDVAGENMSLQSFRRKSDHPNTAIMIYENRIQHDYLETFGIQIVQGRDFDRSMATDKEALIINESAVRLLGLTDPIGEDVIIWEHSGKVIGVVSDFHFQSMHNEIAPLALTIYDPYITRINIRMNHQDRANTMAWIKELFEKADPNYSFRILFCG
jgi:putative ABC transport system permease protein